MSITSGGHVEIAVNMSIGGSQVLNVYDYVITGIAGTPSAVNIAEAWWNGVKAAYRALASTDFGAAFKSVKIKDLDTSTGEAGEYAIPSAEQTGTRTPPAQPQILPLFTAAGVRLTVPTRVTRPGQKRFPFLTESDNDTGTLGSAYTALLNSLMPGLIAPSILGAPAAGTTLRLMVVNKSPPGVFNYGQQVASYVVSTNITSQNTRKPGRGS